MPEDSELDRIDPQPEVFKFSTGFEVEVVRMRTRQFFRLLRVLTHGAGPALQNGLDFSADAPAFASRLLTLVIMSIPDAESEALAYLASMCRPAGLSGKQASQRTKQETANDEALFTQFGEELHNPDLDDTVDLIEVIIRQEAPELQALGKKLERMFKLFQVTGQDKEPPEPEASPQELSLPAPSPQRSTSSATSTDGQTSTSLTSPSADSARPSKQRARAASASTSGSSS
jgi:hypothetical protein